MTNLHQTQSQDEKMLYSANHEVQKSKRVETAAAATKKRALINECGSSSARDSIKVVSTPCSEQTTAGWTVLQMWRDGTPGGQATVSL